MIDCPEVPNSLIRDQNSLSVEIFLDPKLHWFKGHFPAQPLLPGVVQIQWALYYAQKLLAKPMRITSVPQLKFMYPVLPGQTIKLRITCQEKEAAYSVKFNYEVMTKEGLIQSSYGSLVLC